MTRWLLIRGEAVGKVRDNPKLRYARERMQEQRDNPEKVVYSAEAALEWLVDQQWAALADASLPDAAHFAGLVTDEDWAGWTFTMRLALAVESPCVGRAIQVSETRAVELYALLDADPSAR